jgi:plasmid stabilization system protein ParE
MKFAVSVSSRAQYDSDRIFEWIAARSHQGAVAWHRAFEHALHQLQSDADLYGAAAEGSEIGRDIRQRIFRTRRGRAYRLVYLMIGSEVRVLRVRGPGQSSVSDDELQ